MHGLSSQKTATAVRPLAAANRKASIASLGRMSYPCAIAGAVFATFAAAIVGVLYGERHEIQGRILFEPVPAHVAAAQLLPVEDLKSLSLLLKSPTVLEDSIRELNLPISPSDLERRMETKNPAGTSSVAVFLRWPDGNGDAVLNAVMKTFVVRVGELRARSVKERLGALQSALVSCERDYEKARQDLTAFCQSRGIADLSQELRLATSELDALAVTMANLRRSQTNGKAQLVLLNQTIDRMSREDGTPAEPTAPAEKGVAASIAKQAYSPERLQFLIQENRNHHFFEMQLAAKRKQYEHWLTVTKQNGGSAGELERIQTELDALDAQAKDHAKISKLKEILADPDQLSKANQLQALFAKKFEIELELQGNEKNLESLPQEEKTKRDRLDALLNVQAIAAPLLNQVQRRETERVRLQGYVDQLKLQTDLGTAPASILQTASVVSNGWSRRWLLVAAAFVCALIGWAGLIHLARNRFSGRAAEEAIQRLGLPLLGHVPDRRSTGTPMPTELRAFTHLLRQRVHESGAAILFTPIHGGPELDHLLRDASICFANRDERILILDTVIPTRAGNSKTVPGLSDYLARSEIELDAVIRRSELTGVDILSAGSALLPPDALATHRMCNLMDEVRSQYSLILVKGPATTAITDVQIVAGYQDAVVLVLDTTGGLNRDAIDAIRTHLDAGVPILGCVRVENEFPSR